MPKVTGSVGFSLVSTDLEFGNEIGNLRDIKSRARQELS